MKRGGEQGFGAVAAIVVLVILASLSAAMIRFGTVQQMTSAQDVQSARAWSVARAGTEWGLFQALKNGWCDGATLVSQTLDLRGETGFSVTVVCESREFNEGEIAPGVAATVRVYRVDAIACPSASCPDNSAATTPGYIERSRRVVATNR